MANANCEANMAAGAIKCKSQHVNPFNLNPHHVSANFLTSDFRTIFVPSLRAYAFAKTFYSIFFFYFHPSDVLSVHLLYCVRGGKKFSRILIRITDGIRAREKSFGYLNRKCGISFHDLWYFYG